MEGFDYRTHKPVKLANGRALGKMKREWVAQGGTVKQLTTPQGKELWFKDKNGLQVEVYLT